MPDTVKSVHFKWWVFWTGIFNIVAYAALMCPSLYAENLLWHF